MRRGPELRDALLAGMLACATSLSAAESKQAPGCATAGPLNVHIVRHAERAEDGTRDPSLSEAGRARAEALAVALAGTRIDVVHVTALRRTGETAAALVARQNPEVVTWPIEIGQASAHVDALVAAICERHRDQSLLVVGHSNTVPAIVEGLSGHPAEAMSEQAFDRYYHIRLTPDHPADILVLRYGAP